MSLLFPRFELQNGQLPVLATLLGPSFPWEASVQDTHKLGIKSHVQEIAYIYVDFAKISQPSRLPKAHVGGPEVPGRQYLHPALPRKAELHRGASCPDALQ